MCQAGISKFTLRCTIEIKHWLRCKPRHVGLSTELSTYKLPPLTDGVASGSFKPMRNINIALDWKTSTTYEKTIQCKTVSDTLTCQNTTVSARSSTKISHMMQVLGIAAKLKCPSSTQHRHWTVVSATNRQTIWNIISQQETRIIIGSMSDWTRLANWQKSLRGRHKTTKGRTSEAIALRTASVMFCWNLRDNYGISHWAPDKLSD